MLSYKIHVLYNCVCGIKKNSYVCHAQKSIGDLLVQAVPLVRTIQISMATHSHRLHAKINKLCHGVSIV